MRKLWRYSTGTNELEAESHGQEGRRCWRTGWHVGLDQNMRFVENNESEELHQTRPLCATDWTVSVKSPAGVASSLAAFVGSAWGMFTPDWSNHNIPPFKCCLQCDSSPSASGPFSVPLCVGSVMSSCLSERTCAHCVKGIILLLWRALTLSGWCLSLCIAVLLFAWVRLSQLFLFVGLFHWVSRHLNRGSVLWWVLWSWFTINFLVSAFMLFTFLLINHFDHSPDFRLWFEDWGGKQPLNFFVVLQQEAEKSWFYFNFPPKFVLIFVMTLPDLDTSPGDGSPWIRLAVMFYWSST